MYKIKTLILLGLVASIEVIYAQNKIVPSSRKNLLDQSLVSHPKEESLQAFVENIYLNSSIFHYGVKPALEKGDFSVLIMTSASDTKLMKSRELARIKKEDISEISFKKSKSYDALYGEFASTFGMVIITLKN
ncbi:MULTISPECIES: hypothetical protein [Sphingobacterium]|uniref:Uncharacterized protein n=1 Tax=Sphingobacterium kitahiroshimense TaxID=470446 RepID=A0ABV0BXW7_9SPHI|nr:hypothetical protein [Sphingobacterium sp. JUb56]MBB2950919.1 hypothetical protein [Sphingobacterium sp. JUb56]